MRCSEAAKYRHSRYEEQCTPGRQAFAGCETVGAIPHSRSAMSLPTPTCVPRHDSSRGGAGRDAPTSLVNSVLPGQVCAQLVTVGTVMPRRVRLRDVTRPCRVVALPAAYAEAIALRRGELAAAAVTRGDTRCLRYGALQSRHSRSMAGGVRHAGRCHAVWPSAAKIRGKRFVEARDFLLLAAFACDRMALVEVRSMSICVISREPRARFARYRMSAMRAAQAIRFRERRQPALPWREEAFHAICVEASLLRHAAFSDDSLYDVFCCRTSELRALRVRRRERQLATPARTPVRTDCRGPSVYACRISDAALFAEDCSFHGSESP